MYPFLQVRLLSDTTPCHAVPTETSGLTGGVLPAVAEPPVPQGADKSPLARPESFHSSDHLDRCSEPVLTARTPTERACMANLPGMGGLTQGNTITTSVGGGISGGVLAHGVGSNVGSITVERLPSNNGLPINRMASSANGHGHHGAQGQHFQGQSSAGGCANCHNLHTAHSLFLRNAPLLEEVRGIRETLQAYEDKRISREDNDRRVREWRVIACVTDRLFFITYVIINFIGLMVIFLGT